MQGARTTTIIIASLIKKQILEVLLDRLYCYNRVRESCRVLSSNIESHVFHGHVSACECVVTVCASQKLSISFNQKDE